MPTVDLDGVLGCLRVERIDGDRWRAPNLEMDYRRIFGGQLLPATGDGRLAEAVYEGEAIRAERLAAHALSAVAARLPAGTRAMAIPMEAGLVPALTIGDRVDVLVAVPAEAAAGGPPGFALAEAALVVDVTEQAVTVALPRDLAPRLAVAFGHGAVSLALVGG